MSTKDTETQRTKEPHPLCLRGFVVNSFQKKFSPDDRRKIAPLILGQPLGLFGESALRMGAHLPVVGDFSGSSAGP